MPPMSFRSTLRGLVSSPPNAGVRVTGRGGAWIRFASALLFWPMAFSTMASAGPRVSIVIGEQASALEQLAAKDLQGLLTRLYEADVHHSTTPPADAAHVILLGNLHTNPHITSLLAPVTFGTDAAGQQAHLLKSVTLNNRDALVIAGGSPAATYWAVAEYGHRLGVRAMFLGDLDPVSPPPFRLDGFNILLRPLPLTRGWRFSFDPLSAGAWNLDDWRKVLRNLAQRKFNEVHLSLAASEPWVHYESGGVARNSGALWDGALFPVSGDTLGRKAFSGAKLFENPAFSGAATYSQRIACGQQLLHGVLQAARDLGMTVTCELPIYEFPIEFRPPTRAADATADRKLSFAVSPQELLENGALSRLAKLQWQAFRTAYPEMSRTIVRVDPEVARRVLGAESVAMSQLTSISVDRSNSFLPTFALPQFIAACTKARVEPDGGICMEATNLGDADAAAFWLSRFISGETLPTSAALQQLLDPVCGDEVHQRVAIGFAAVEEGLRLGSDEWREIPDAARGARAFQALLSAREPPPATWAALRDQFLNAMNEMYRANIRARDGNRAYTLYFARRFEFAMEYLNCVEAARKAGVARAQGQPETHVAELEKAIESLNGALNAQAAVARSPGDRAVIALLNQYGYRVLKQALEDAE